MRPLRCGWRVRWPSLSARDGCAARADHRALRLRPVGQLRGVSRCGFSPASVRQHGSVASQLSPATPDPVRFASTPDVSTIWQYAAMWPLFSVGAPCLLMLAAAALMRWTAPAAGGAHAVIDRVAVSLPPQACSWRIWWLAQECPTASRRTAPCRLHCGSIPPMIRHPPRRPRPEASDAGTSTAWRGLPRAVAFVIQLKPAKHETSSGGLRSATPKLHQVNEESVWSTDRRRQPCTIATAQTPLPADVLHGTAMALAWRMPAAGGVEQLYWPKACRAAMAGVSFWRRIALEAANIAAVCCATMAGRAAGVRRCYQQRLRPAGGTCPPPVSAARLCRNANVRRATDLSGHCCTLSSSWRIELCRVDHRRRSAALSSSSA